MDRLHAHRRLINFIGNSPYVQLLPSIYVRRTSTSTFDLSSSNVFNRSIPILGHLKQVCRSSCIDSVVRNMMISTIVFSVWGCINHIETSTLWYIKPILICRVYSIIAWVMWIRGPNSRPSLAGQTLLRKRRRVWPERRRVWPARLVYTESY